MADAADEANDITELFTAAAIRSARRPIPMGEPGVCRSCDEDSARLVNGRCAPCRDGRVLH